MNESHGYALEKLSEAVYLLATGEGHVRQRLRDAFISFHAVMERDFPDDLKVKWRWIDSQLKRFGPIMDGDKVVEGSVDHTLRRIRNSTGQRIAQAIVELEYELRTRRALRH